MSTAQIKAIRTEAGGMPQTALDALPLEIAVLSASGTVLFANRAWSASGSRLVRQAAAAANLFDSCKEIILEHDQNALREGLRAVVARERDEFRLDYQGGKNGEWYRLRCTRYEATQSPEVLTLPPEKRAAVLVIHESIADLKHVERELQQAEKKFKSMFENAIEGIFQTTRDGKYLSVNPALVRTYGYDSADDLIAAMTDIGRQLYVDPRRRSEFVRLLEAFDHISGFEAQIYRKDGSVIWISENARAVRDNHGALLYYEGTVENITLRKNAEDALKRSEQKYRELIEKMVDGLVIVDRNGVIEYANGRFVEMLRCKREDLLYRHLLTLPLTGLPTAPIPDPSNTQPYEISATLNTGQTLWLLVSDSPVYDSQGAITGAMKIFTDISERKRIEERLAHDAFHDMLTRLPNRSLFMDRLSHVIDHQKRRESYLYAVLFLDLDRFKIVNDSLGHAAGDKLLIEVASRLQTCVRLDDTIARLGGDEFTILLEDVGGIGEVIQVVERIQKEISRPVELPGNQIFTSASIGIAIGKPGQGQPELILSNADTAMYRAKAQGKARYEIFTEAMQAGVMSQLQIQTDLRRAVEDSEFRVFYQPLVALDTERVIGFEALVRWIHPRIGLVSPSEFIGLAEEMGLIHRIGMWVLQESCRQTLCWDKEFPDRPPLFVSVNLSTRQFAQANLAGQIGRILVDTGFPPKRLKLEITESAIIQNATSSALEQLKAIGLQLVIDDFGTGYSSLSYLHQLPIDALKIDRSFVNQMGDTGKKAEIVRSIMTLARNLKLDVVAEGIEKRNQLERLKELGCPTGQGYLFSKPVDAENARKLLI